MFYGWVIVGVALGKPMSAWIFDTRGSDDTAILIFTGSTLVAGLLISLIRSGAHAATEPAAS